MTLTGRVARSPGELLLAQEQVPAFRADGPDGTLAVNGPLARLLGHDSPRDLEGTALRGLLAGGEAWEELARAIDRGGPVATRLALRRRDGSTVAVTLEASAAGAEPGGGAVYGIVAETAAEVPFVPGLHDRERWFRAISTFGTHLVIVIDLDGRVRYANPAVERLAGIPLDEGRGRPVFEFLHPADRATARRRIGEAIASPGAMPSVEVRLQSRHEGERIVHATGIYLPDFPGGECLLLYGRDVTAQHELQREYLRAQKLEAVALLAAGLAHDFNNLLTTILGHAQLLARATAAADPRRRSCDEIAEAATRGARLTRQLLGLGRGQVVQVRPLRLGDEVTALAGALERLLPANVRFHTELAPGTPMVEADPGAIEQVLLNLVVNARDAIEGPGRIGVRVAPADASAPAIARAGVGPGPWVELAVTDDGAGMDEAVRRRIFEPFFTTKEPGRGSGLGLPSVQDLVRRCGGTIVVESEPGRGSTFRVLLPARPDAAVPAAPAAGPPAPRPFRTARVMFVEDDPAILRVTGESLARSGHQVWTAADATAASTLAARLDDAPPEVLVSDIVLPDEDGVTLARRMLARWPQLKVVLTSGYSSHGDRVEELVAGGHRFLEKPYTLGHLLSAIEDSVRSDAGHTIHEEAA